MPSAEPNLEAARARVGTVVDGRWRLDALVAVGGSSAIYAATHRNGLRVAMKVLDSELTQNHTAVTHFLREGRAVNGIPHPGVVPVLDEGTMVDGAPFLLMPLLEGETAQQRLMRHRGGLPAREALGIVEAVLDVLVAAHARGVVHRDLKPDNVFLERGGAVRLLDFGVAHVASNDLDLTAYGTVVGTAGYLPPEQAQGRTHEVGPRSDVWAVGATLYTLLTGRTLHEGAHLLASIVRAQTEAVPPARVLVPGVSEAVGHVLDGALAFEPDDRWIDATAMRCAVRAALDDLGARDKMGSCPGVTVDSLAPRALSDAPAGLDRVRITRRPLAWMVAACVAAAWIAAAFVVRGTHASRDSQAPIAIAAAAPAPPSVEPPVTVAQDPASQPEVLAPEAVPTAAAGGTVTPPASSARPSPAKASRRPRGSEIVRTVDF